MCLLSARSYRPRHSLACRWVAVSNGLVSVQLTIIAVTLRALLGLGTGVTGSASRQTVIRTQQEKPRSVHVRGVTSLVALSVGTSCSLPRVVQAAWYYILLFYSEVVELQRLKDDTLQLEVGKNKHDCVMQTDAWRFNSLALSLDKMIRYLVLYLPCCVYRQFHCSIFAHIFRRDDKISKMSVCPSTWNNSAPSGRVFIKFDISVFFENLSRKFKFH